MNNFQQKKSWWTQPPFPFMKCHEQVVFFPLKTKWLTWLKVGIRLSVWIRALKSIVFSINLHLLTRIKTRPLTFLNTDLWGPVWQATFEEDLHNSLLRAEPNQKKFCFCGAWSDDLYPALGLHTPCVGQQIPGTERGCGSVLSHRCMICKGWNRESKGRDPLTCLMLQAWDLTGLSIVNIYGEMPRLGFIGFYWLQQSAYIVPLLSEE